MEQKFNAFVVIIRKGAHTLHSFIHGIYGDHSLKFLSTLATKVNSQRDKIHKPRDHNNISINRFLVALVVTIVNNTKRKREG